MNSRMLSIVKVLLPYLPPASRKLIFVFVLMEQLQETTRMFQEINALRSLPFRKQDGNLLEVLKETLSPKERETLEQYTNMLQMFQMFQELQQCNEQDNAEECNKSINKPLSDFTDIPTNGVPPFNPADLLRSMLSPEQEELFSLFQGHSLDNNSETN